jgi:hypothetical protein
VIAKYAFKAPLRSSVISDPRGRLVSSEVVRSEDWN